MGKNNLGGTQSFGAPSRKKPMHVLPYLYLSSSHRAPGLGALAVSPQEKEKKRRKIFVRWGYPFSGVTYCSPTVVSVSSTHQNSRLVFPAGR